MDIVFATDASPVWRAIEFGLELLKKGLIWRVGDGKQISVTNDNWIPGDEFLRPYGSRVANPPENVSELIDATVACWNINGSKKFFCP